MVCTDHHHPTSTSRRSSNLEQIDRLIEAIDTAAPSPEEQSQDPLAPLSSSLQEVYMNFGYFDSLTLAEQRLSAKDSKDASSSDDNGPKDDTEADGPKDDTDITLDDMLMWTQEEEDGLQASWSELDSSWENISKAGPGSLTRQGSSRSCVRRGQQEAAKGSASIKIMEVPTKHNRDDPSSGGARTRFHVTSAKLKEKVPQRQMSPAAA